MTTTLSQTRGLRRVVACTLYLLAAWLVLIIFTVRPGFDGYERAMFPDMVYGRAYRPYVYRTLVPTAVRVITGGLPRQIKTLLGRMLTKKYSDRFQSLGWDPAYVIEYFTALLLTFCCFLAFAVVLRRLVMVFYDAPAFVTDLAPLAGLLAVPACFKYFNYIYDPATLLLSATALALIARRRHLLFYAVLALATVNKETALFFIPVFALREHRCMPSSRLALHAALQCALWATVRLGLMVCFSRNPGPAIEFHLLDHNLELFLHPAGVFGPIRMLYVAAVVVILWRVIRHKWAGKPLLLRRGLLATVIPILVLQIFFSFIDELRVYYEALPFVFLLALPTMADLFGFACRTRQASESSAGETFHREDNSA